MKKIVSILCLVALLMSTMTFGTVFADDAAGISIKYNKYEELNGNKILYVDVVCEMPELWINQDDPLGIGLYEYTGQLLQSFNWKIKYDSTNMTYVAGKSTASDIASVVNNSTSGTMDAIMAANADFNYWYTGSNFTWTLAFLIRAADAANYVPEFSVPYGGTSYTIVTQETPVDTIISNASNSTVYKDSVAVANGNQKPLAVSVEEIPSYNDTIVDDKTPVEKNGLFTDASQKLQITEPKMTSNGYAIDKALIFASSINATNDASEYGTAILREGFGEFTADNEFLFKVKAENTYDVDTDTKGFLGAISSIREGNYGKTFSAKAYMIVDEVMYFANETAENVYNAQ